MRDVDHAVVRHPEHARLLERLVEERLGRHRRGGNPEPLEPDHVVHTARRAGASVREALHRQVAAVGDAADELGLGGLGEDLLRDAERLGPVLAQARLDAVEELVAPALGDVEQRDARSFERVAARGERLRRAASFVERAHVLHATSLETIFEFMPRHGPSTAEYRPASPPAASSTMSSGLSHLAMSVSGSAAWTRGVVSPRRSSRAGLRTASNMASRSRCLLQPAPANIAWCSGQMTYTDVPPSGHQFGLHVAAPAQPSAHARSSGVVARWSEIDSGASQPTTVTTESSRANPRSTCSGSHGLPASSSAMQKPSLPGWPSVDRSSRPGAPPPVSVTTRRSARPRVSFARQPGPSTPIPLCTPIASPTGPLTITS